MCVRLSEGRMEGGFGEGKAIESEVEFGEGTIHKGEGGGVE